MTTLGSIKSFISTLAQGSGPRNQFGDNAQLATAALLVRVATADSEMSDVRRKKLYHILKANFSLDDLSTNQLIKDACAAERNSIDLYQFTRQINSAFDEEGRRRIVKMMWEAIYVEGSLNGFEANIIWRTADLLGVSSRQRIEIRQQIAAEAAVLAPV
jgi:uncharacterized tellurite resistance protein B-like protein